MGKKVGDEGDYLRLPESLFLRHRTSRLSDPGPAQLERIEKGMNQRAMSRPVQTELDSHSKYHGPAIIAAAKARENKMLSVPAWRLVMERLPR